MSGKTIAFVIEKGGTGKSTIAFNVAWEMSRKQKVLLVDLDAQKANLTYFCGIKKNDVKTIREYFNDSSTLKELTINVRPGLDIIPANDVLNDIGTPNHFQQLEKLTQLSSSRDYQLYLIDKMQKLMHQACQEYDYVFLDPNPAPNYLHTLALCSAEYIIIPVLPDAASVESDQGTAESIEIVRETGINENIHVLGVLFNRYTNRTVLSKQVKAITEILAKNMGTTVFKSTVRNSVVLSECVGMHTGITDYRPKCPAADDIREVVAEIKRRIRNVKKL